MKLAEVAFHYSFGKSINDNSAHIITNTVPFITNLQLRFCWEVEKLLMKLYLRDDRFTTKNKASN